MKKILLSGMQNTYYGLMRFDDYNYSIKSKVIEYIFTVGIAKEILENIKSLPANSTINLEFPSNLFVEHAFDLFLYKQNKNKPFIQREFVRRLEHKSVRKGRIDIAVLTKYPGVLWKRSLFGIEVKGVNPSIKALKKDFDRLEKALLEEDPIGENSIKECYLVFLKRFDNPKKLFDRADLVQALKDYDKILGEFRNNTKLDIQIDYNDVHTEFSEDYAKSIPEDDLDYSDVAANSGSIGCFIITMKRK